MTKQAHARAAYWDHWSCLLDNVSGVQVGVAGSVRLDVELGLCRTGEAQVNQHPQAGWMQGKTRQWRAVGTADGHLRIQDEALQVDRQVDARVTRGQHLCAQRLRRGQGQSTDKHGVR